MAEKQGGAEVSVRNGVIVVIAAAESMGWQTEDGIWRGLSISDWEAFCGKASIDHTDAELGALVRQCLLKSRLVTLEWSRAERSQPASQYNARLAAAFGLSSTRGLYTGMKDVGIDWAGDDVRFAPSRNRGRGVFEGFARGHDHGHETIAMSIRASDEEIGAALREAIQRSL